MPIQPPPTGASRLFDALASRTGLAVSILILALFGLAAIIRVETSAKNLEDSLIFFQDGQRRNGVAALSDVQRLLNIAGHAWSVGGFSQAASYDFQAATDMLYVRADHFETVLERTVASDSAQAAVTVLRDIVETADTAMTQGFPDLEGLLQALQDGQERSRQELIKFLTDMDRLQNEALEDQAHAIADQRIVVRTGLGGLAILALAAFLLLRREVLAREAREEAEREVEFLAYFDPLTSLANRAQFTKRLTELLSKPAPVTLLLIDLDRFKAINDSHGQAAGDGVLVFVADAMRQALSDYPNSFAARLGGDEFAIVVPEKDVKALNLLCKELIAFGTRKLTHEGEELSCSMSMGIAASTQIRDGLGDPFEALTRISDFALNAAKAAGRNRFEYYSEVLERKLLERRALVDALPRAIRNGGLEVFMQPKVMLADGAPYGFEALVRWRRDGQIVPPDRFIDVAEESGLILELDRFILNQATQLMTRLNKDFGLALSVSVNLSGLHFTSRRIIDWVDAALQNAGLDPSLLTLEITETVELRDWDRTRAIIAGLRERGVRISIDDFGTGYSSIGYLFSISADELKLDRSLISEIETNMTSRFLVDSVLDMATNLKLETVVEGIETQSQAQEIQRLGGARGQGYLYGRPMEESAVRAYLANLTAGAQIPQVPEQIDKTG